MEALELSLVFERRLAIFPEMSATEIIEQIKNLSAEEREQVKEYFDADMTDNLSKAVDYVPRAALEKSADKIFNNYEKLFQKLAQ
jgi:hypothetical protein